MDLVKLATQALERPQDFGWWGKEEMFHTWGWAGIDQHRDSSILELSNFAVITKDLMDRFPEQFEVVGMGHWAVGHVDRLIVQILKNDDAGIVEDNITEAFAAAMDWVDNLQEYPVADDMHYSEMEYQEIMRCIEEDIPHFAKREDGDVSAIYSWLSEHNIEIIPDAQMYANPNDIALACYYLNYIDPDYKEDWDDFCDMMGISRVKYTFDGTKVSRPDPNQLKLF